MAGVRTCAAEKKSGDELQEAELPARSSAGACGFCLRRYGSKELATIRDAKNALAVEGVLVGLRRFPPDAEGAVRWVTTCPYTHDRTLTLGSCHCPLRLESSVNRGCDARSDIGLGDRVQSHDKSIV